MAVHPEPARRSLKLAIALILLVAVCIFVPPVRGAIDRVRFPRRTFSVAMETWDYSFDSARDSLDGHGVTIPFRLPPEAMDQLYQEAIASRLFDTGQPRRIERLHLTLPESKLGFILRSGFVRHSIAWTGDDAVMRDYKDHSWERILHFRASVDSLVRGQQAFRDLPPPRFFPM